MGISSKKKIVDNPWTWRNNNFTDEDYLNLDKDIDLNKGYIHRLAEVHKLQP